MKKQIWTHILYFLSTATEYLFGFFLNIFPPVDDLYESVNDREIRQVFEGQNRIHLEIKQLHRQLAMILDEQRRYVSVITDEISKKAASTGSGQVGKTDSHKMQTKSLIVLFILFFSLYLLLILWNVCFDCRR